MREGRDIEDVLAWAYGDEKIGRTAFARIPVGPAPVGSQMQSVGEIGNLGVRVDRSPYVVPTAPTDAEAVHLAVMALPRQAREIVMEVAETGRRPEWLPDQRPCPVPNKFGEPTVVYHDPGKRERPSHCPVMYLPDKVRLDHSRMMYALWHTAVSALAVSLKGCLERCEVTGPAASPEPWSDKGVDKGGGKVASLHER